MVSFRGANTVIFRRFLLSYVFVLVVPLVLSAFAYRAASRAIEESAIQARLSMLSQTRDIIDRHFMELDEMMLQIALHPKLSRILSLQDPGDGDPEVYQIWDYARDLRLRTVTTSVFKSMFYVFCNSSEFVFTHDSTYYDYERFYRDAFSYTGMDCDQWKELYFSTRHLKHSLPAREMLVEDVQKSYVTYMSSVPLLYDVEPKGLVVFLIAEEDITGLMRGLSLPEGGWVAVRDGETTITSTGGAPQEAGPLSSHGYRHISHDGKETVVVSTTSSHNGWSYIAGFPYYAITERVRMIGRTALLVAAISLIVGLVVSCYLALRNTRPFSDLATTLRDVLGGEPQGGYEYLSGGVNRLISDSRSLRSELSSRSATMRKVFFDRLLKGEFGDRKRMVALLEHVGIEVKGGQFLVVALRVVRNVTLVSSEILDELEAVGVLLETTIRRSFTSEVFPHVVDESLMAVVLSFPGRDASSFRSSTDAAVRSIREEFSSRYGVAPSIGIGRIYGDLYDTHHSYREALRALDRAAGSAVWYEDIRLDSLSFFYPPDVESKLINLTKAGNREELGSVLERIHRENYVDRALSRDLERILHVDMKATLVKLRDELGDTVAVSEPLEASGDAFERLRSAFLDTCDAVGNRERTRLRGVVRRMIEHIEANYGDRNLSVASVASEFHLSESYLSHLFKAQTGENLSAYLERLRIGHAARLLTEGGRNVNEAAFLSGYANASSFRRAFKRATGRSPSSLK